jgi:N-acetylglucosaminyldiphosphoundecaprenol N-acetyl-beta-D-mannosaminyltransferase
MIPAGAQLAESARDETPSPGRERVNVLGVGVDPVNQTSALATIERWIATRDQQYVTVTGIHGIMESQQDEGVRAIHNGAGLVVPDGMPLVWLSRLHGFARADRVYGPDLLLACCQRSLATGHRHYFYGAGTGVPEQLIARLRTRFPGLPVAGGFSPPFRALTPEEDDAIVRQINATRPDIVWVGLSTPKQERWMAEHRNRLDAPVLIGVGAAFDFHAGLKRQAPRWMQRSGLEWVFRLLCEPRRLWRRYLRNNPVFVWKLLLQWLGVKQYQAPGDPAARPVTSPVTKHVPRPS